MSLPIDIKLMAYLTLGIESEAIAERPDSESENHA